MKQKMFTLKQLNYLISVIYTNEQPSSCIAGIRGFVKFTPFKIQITHYSNLPLFWS